MPTQNRLRFLLMLMLRIVLATVCCRFGSWGLVIKLNYCSDLLNKLNFGFSIKHQQPTSKSWPNLVLKVWTKVLLYDQIYNKLLPTRSSLSTSATVTASTSFELIGLRSDKTDPGFSICLHFYFPSLCPISLLLLSVCSSPAPPLLSFIIQAPAVSY